MQWTCRNLYRTVWELKQREIVQMAADRAPFIDQTQSLNIHMAEPTFEKVTALHFTTWSLVCPMLPLIPIASLCSL